MTQITDEMVERAAVAIMETNNQFMREAREVGRITQGPVILRWEAPDEYPKACYRRKARAALEAALAVALLLLVLVGCGGGEHQAGCWVHFQPKWDQANHPAPDRVYARPCPR